jgi:hypoxanthine-guanine phosphoribosyltransferase
MFLDLQDPGRRNFVIVDDICDGGRTFLETKTIRSERNISISLVIKFI